MKRYNLKPDKNNFGKFPKCTGKPPTMLLMEKELGVTFEDDYKDKYLSQGWGQRKFAERWTQNRSHIFSKTPGQSRRSWLQILEDNGIASLLIRDECPILEFKAKKHCSACQKEIDQYDTMELAHWYSRHKGGGLTHQICEGCHGRMDKGDKEIAKKYLQNLLGNKSDWSSEEVGDLINGCLERF